MLDAAGVVRVRIGKDGADYGVKMYDPAGANPVSLATLAFGMQSQQTSFAQTTSGSYANPTLGNVGPTVNVTLGPSGTMLVILAGHIRKTDSARQLYMSFEVSGASSYAANDVRALTLTLSITGAYTLESSVAAAYVVTELNTGAHTVQAKYRSALAGSTSADMYDPVLSVLPF